MIVRIGRRRPNRLFIKEWMAYINKNQKEMAALLDCEPGTVSKLLNPEAPSKHKMEMTVSWLERFAAVFSDALGREVRVIDLYRDPNMPTQDDLLRNLPESEQARIVAAIRLLTGTNN